MATLTSCFVVTLSAVVGMVGGDATISTTQDPHNPPTYRCCHDNKFEAVLMTSGIQLYPIINDVVVLDEEEQLFYDFQRKRTTTITALRYPSGAVLRTFTLHDWNTRTTYSRQESGPCYYAPMANSVPDIQSPCIPDNATFEGQSTLGFSPHTLVVNTWKFELPPHQPTPGDSGIQVYMDVTQHFCIPVSHTKTSTVNGVFRKTTSVYKDYRTGISDPDILAIPTGCQRQSG